MEDDIKMFPMMQPNKLISTDCGDHVLYEYYLVGSIGNPDDYIELCHALRSARQEDHFIIRINSGGGQVRSGNQIINAIQESEAVVVGFIEHDCGSMATFIFLACDSWGVSKYAEWFSHTVSGGNYGKECETYEAAQFLRKQTHKRIREEYANFLHPEEIEAILTGTDIYLDSDEVMERLENFDKMRAERESAEMEGYEPPPTIEDMMLNAAKKALVEHEAEKAKKEAKARKAAEKKKPVHADWGDDPKAVKEVEKGVDEGYAYK